MVDALRSAWSVLRPRGHVVDVRPVSAYRPTIAIRRDRRRLRVGPIRRYADPDVVAASRALRAVVREGLFARTRSVRVRYTASHPALSDVDATFAGSENWHLPAATRRRIVTTWRPGDTIEIGMAFSLTDLRRRER